MNRGETPYDALWLEADKPDESDRGDATATKRFRTIVVDPPWHYDRMGGGYVWREGAPSGVAGRQMLSYPMMTTNEIAALPVGDLAAPDAHVYCWTTQRYLRATFGIVEGWGFEYRKLLTWAKPPTGFSLGGAWGSSTEFVAFAARGRLAHTGKVSRDWWDWSRHGHSVKPEAFLDLVESVSPGPYLELFSRRARLGWDVWGDEVDSHIDLAGGVA